MFRKFIESLHFWKKPVDTPPDNPNRSPSGMPPINPFPHVQGKSKRSWWVWLIYVAIAAIFAISLLVMLNISEQISVTNQALASLGKAVIYTRYDVLETRTRLLVNRYDNLKVKYESLAGLENWDTKKDELITEFIGFVDAVGKGLKGNLSIEELKEKATRLSEIRRNIDTIDIWLDEIQSELDKATVELSPPPLEPKLSVEIITNEEVNIEDQITIDITLLNENSEPIKQPIPIILRIQMPNGDTREETLTSIDGQAKYEFPAGDTPGDIQITASAEVLDTGEAMTDDETINVVSPEPQYTIQILSIEPEEIPLDGEATITITTDSDGVAIMLNSNPADVIDYDAFVRVPDNDNWTSTIRVKQDAAADLNLPQPVKIAAVIGSAESAPFPIALVEASDQLETTYSLPAGSIIYSTNVLADTIWEDDGALIQDVLPGKREVFGPATLPDDPKAPVRIRIRVHFNRLLIKEPDSDNSTIQKDEVLDFQVYFPTTNGAGSPVNLTEYAVDYQIYELSGDLNGLNPDDYRNAYIYAVVKRSSFP